MTDNTAALQRLIDRAIASGPDAEIVLGPGNYRLDCSTSKLEHFCLTVVGAIGLTLRGSSASVTQITIANPRRGLVNVKDSERVAFEDFTVDYVLVPFTQGDVIAVNAATREITLRVDDSYIDFAHPLFADPPVLHTSYATFWTPDRHEVIATPKDFVYFRAATRRSGGNWTLELADTEPENVLTSLPPGAHFVMPARIDAAPLFFLADSQDLIVRRLDLFASPGAALTFFRNRGEVLVQHVRVIKRPGTDRMLSTNADAFHLQGNHALVRIASSTVGSTADDALNIYSRGVTVRRVSSPSVVIVDPSSRTGALFQKDDELQIVSEAGVEVAEAKVVNVRPDGELLSLQLDRTVIGATAGLIIYNISAASPNAQIVDNTFLPFRGLFRIRSRDGVFKNNRIHSRVNARVLLGSEHSWLEGPNAKVTFGANAVDGGKLHLLGPNSRPAGEAPP